MILADFNPNDPNLITLASHFPLFTPPHHSIYSHTVAGRTYAYLIDRKLGPPFVYFGIFDEILVRSEERLWFFSGVKDGFYDIQDSSRIAHLSFECLQDEMDFVFRRLFSSHLDELDDDRVNSSTKAGIPNMTSDSFRTTQLNVVKPLLGMKSLEIVNNSRIRCEETSGMIRAKGMESKVDVTGFYNGADDGLTEGYKCKDGNVDDTIFSYEERQKVTRTWRKCVWLVLLMDLLVCLLLFGVWLWICKGFECVAGSN